MHHPKLLIVGCGAVVDNLYLPALRQLGWTPIGFVEPNRAKKDQLHAIFPNAELKSSLDEIESAFESYNG